MVLVHLFVVPCATAMAAMPADADCEHCVAVDGADACLASSGVVSATLDDLAFDSGRADPPLAAVTILPIAAAYEAATSSLALRSPSVAPRDTGDPPIYRLLGQLRL
jgi:hypothetical protein